jgi:hypothetical protein
MYVNVVGRKYPNESTLPMIEGKKAELEKFFDVNSYRRENKKLIQIVTT